MVSGPELNHITIGNQSFSFVTQSVHPLYLGQLGQLMNNLSDPQNDPQSSLLQEVMRASQYLLMMDFSQLGRSSTTQNLDLYKLQLYGHSSFAMQSDEFITDATFPKQLVSIYGVESKGNPIDLLLTHAKECQLAYDDNQYWYLKLFGDRQGGWDCEKREKNYFFGTPDNFSAIKAFLDVYQEHVSQAARMIKCNHPRLNENLVRLFLIRNIVREMVWYDQIDVLQDLAASASVYACRANNYSDVFSGGPREWLAPSLLGQWYWHNLSKEKIAIDYQGFGPGQIIPNLVLEAIKDTQLSRLYWCYLPLNDYLYEGVDAVIHDIFDENMLFYLKGLTFDLQLKNVKNSGDFQLPYDSAPFLQDAEDSWQLANLLLADELVQMPDRRPKLQGVLNRLIMDLAVLSVLFSIPLDLKDVSVRRKDDLPLSDSVYVSYNLGEFIMDDVAYSVWSRFPKNLLAD